MYAAAADAADPRESFEQVHTIDAGRDYGRLRKRHHAADEISLSLSLFRKKASTFHTASGASRIFRGTQALG